VNIRKLIAADLSGAIKLLQRFFREEPFSISGEVVAQNTRRVAVQSSTAAWDLQTKAG
jgi:hypothetical protein